MSGKTVKDVILQFMRDNPKDRYNAEKAFDYLVRQFPGSSSVKLAGPGLIDRTFHFVRVGKFKL